MPTTVDIKTVVFICVVISLMAAAIAAFRGRRTGYRTFFKDFLDVLSPKSQADFLAYLDQHVTEYRLLEGIRHHGNRLWEQLHVRPGDSIFELGPGHGFLAIKAALNGASVVMLEHPKSHYLQFLRPNIERFRDAIANAHGTITLIEGDVLDPAIEKRITDQYGQKCFDRVIVIDVLRPRYGDNFQQAVYRHELKWGPGTGKPKFGIFEPHEVSRVVDFLLSLKRPGTGSIYVNHTSSLERSMKKIERGILSPDFPFESIGEFDTALVGVAQSSRQLPTPRNPLRAAKIYDFGKGQDTSSPLVNDG